MNNINIVEKKDNNPEELHLLISKDKKRATGSVRIIKYIDKDTNYLTAYCPSFEISAYGETPEEVERMLKSSINSFFEYLTDLSPKKRDEELSSLGWKKNRIKNKDYSKSYVDHTGALKDFAVPDTIKTELIAV